MRVHSGDALPVIFVAVTDVWRRSYCSSAITNSHIQSEADLRTPSQFLTPLPCGFFQRKFGKRFTKVYNSCFPNPGALSWGGHQAEQTVMAYERRYTLRNLQTPCENAQKSKKTRVIAISAGDRISVQKIVCLSILNIVEENCIPAKTEHIQSSTHFHPHPTRQNTYTSSFSPGNKTKVSSRPRTP